jgi:Leu/Phe-tRNA-protein transferase
MNSLPMAPTVAEFLAQILPPSGYEHHIVVQRRGVFVWAKRNELQADDAICFYDGDCREVFKPDDPRLESLMKSSCQPSR